MTNDERFLAAIYAALYPNESPDPRHPANCNNRDWLDGYAEGLAYGTDAKNGHGITAEFYRRGYGAEKPCEDDPTWKPWKRGFNAGSLRRAMSIARSNAEKSK